MLKLRSYSAAWIFKVGGALGAAMLTAQPAMAEDSCTNAKNLSNALKAFYKADPSFKDVIDPQFLLAIHADEGLPTITEIMYRDDTQKRRFDMDEYGNVLGLEAAVDMISPDGEICSMVDGVIVQKQKDPKTSVSVSMTFPYRNQTGNLLMRELAEGAKDGSKIMKSLAPTGLGLFVPKLKSVVVSPASKDAALPVLSLLKKGKPVDAPKAAMLDRDQYYILSQLKKTKADSVMVSGDYILRASFEFKAEDIEKAEEKRLADLAADK